MRRSPVVLIVKNPTFSWQPREKINTFLDKLERYHIRVVEPVLDFFLHPRN